MLTATLFADAVAYAALLRNELLGAGIESVPDPHTDDRRHAAFSQGSHSLFRVGLKEKEEYLNVIQKDSWQCVTVLFVCLLQYTVHTKRVPFDSDNEVSPYSLSPLSNKR